MNPLRWALLIIYVLWDLITAPYEHEDEDS